MHVAIQLLWSVREQIQKSKSSDLPTIPVRGVRCYQVNDGRVVGGAARRCRPSHWRPPVHEGLAEAGVDSGDAAQ
jgi:hypothetical protein